MPATSQDDNPAVSKDVALVRVGIVSRNFSRLKVIGVMLNQDGHFKDGDQLQLGAGQEGDGGSTRVITVTSIERLRQRVHEANASQGGREFGVFTGHSWTQVGIPVFRIDQIEPAEEQ